LYTKNDIGKSKVECALKELEKQNIKTEIIGYDMDA
jgi:molybdopterin/thiamine biosynthesis adenylyltransferase